MKHLGGWEELDSQKTLQTVETGVSDPDVYASRFSGKGSEPVTRIEKDERLVPDAIDSEGEGKDQQDPERPGHNQNQPKYLTALQLENWA